MAHWQMLRSASTLFKLLFNMSLMQERSQIIIPLDIFLKDHTHQINTQEVSTVLKSSRSTKLFATSPPISLARLSCRTQLLQSLTVPIMLPQLVSTTQQPNPPASSNATSPPQTSTSLVLCSVKHLRTPPPSSPMARVSTA